MLRAVMFLTAFIAAQGALASCPAYLDHDLRRLHSSESVNLCANFGNGPMLIVNTASHCGYTKQLGGLEALYQQYRERGLAVVGFASDDFFQEADEEGEAADICFKNYGVTFTMFAPSHVRGSDANPVFAELARQSKAPSWNFNKYLVDRSGKVVGHFGSSVSPDSDELRSAIEKAL